MNIDIVKSSVFSEVGRLTNYGGSKKDGDERAFERIATTGSDDNMLEQFWRAACDGVTEAMKRFIIEIKTEKSKTVEGETVTTAGWYATLEVSKSYDETLTDSINTNVFNYIVLSIVSRWYKMTNGDEAADYAAEAVGQLDEALSKLFYKKKPTRKPVH